MEKENVNEELISIDLLRAVKTLWKRKWRIAAAALFAAALLAFISAVFITPEYEAGTLLYINNSVQGLEASKISTSDLSASQSLVKAYIAILQNRTTLDMVIGQYGIPHTAEELLKMIDAETVTGTQVLKVTVTSEDPAEAARIANAVSDVLVARAQEIMEGSSMRIVDGAVIPEKQASPKYLKNTVIGFFAGFVIACAAAVIADMLDRVVHSEDDITEQYDLPLLASIPDLCENDACDHADGHLGGYGKTGSAQ